MNENTKTYPKPSHYNQRPAYHKRSLEDLNVIDDFLMNAAAFDPEGGPEFCRLLLSTLLGRKIGRVEVNTQKSIPACTLELRGVRLDVEVREATETVLNIYDIEPCLYDSNEENLAERNRFYQGRIDGRYLSSGERDFSQLPNLYVIMILPFDPFGEDYMMYQFRNRCEEVPDLDYPDGLRYIYFNTRGTKGGSPAIRQMLDYLQKSTEENVKGETLQEIHRHVKRVKILPEVKQEFMLFGEKIDYERKKAAEEAAREAARAAKIEQATESVLDVLEEYGDISDELSARIQNEDNLDTLKKWIKLAVRCDSLEAFEAQMEG